MEGVQRHVDFEFIKGCRKLAEAWVAIIIVAIDVMAVDITLIWTLHLYWSRDELQSIVLRKIE